VPSPENITELRKDIPGVVALEERIKELEAEVAEKTREAKFANKMQTRLAYRLSSANMRAESARADAVAGYVRRLGEVLAKCGKLAFDNVSREEEATQVWWNFAMRTWFAGWANKMGKPCAEASDPLVAAQKLLNTLRGEVEADSPTDAEREATARERLGDMLSEIVETPRSFDDLRFCAKAAGRLFTGATKADALEAAADALEVGDRE